MSSSSAMAMTIEVALLVIRTWSDRWNSRHHFFRTMPSSASYSVAVSPSTPPTREPDPGLPKLAMAVMMTGAN